MYTFIFYPYIQTSKQIVDDFVKRHIIYPSNFSELIIFHNKVN